MPTKESALPQDLISLNRWPSETPLFVTSLVIGIIIWLGLLAATAATLPVSLFVVLYVAIFVAAYFVARVAFVTLIRGNAARLGPEQFPELFERVSALASRMGLKRVPEAYLMQAGGALNALAARFIRTSIVVLYSDLIEACGDNEAARDMIITHELAHVRLGHLRLRWLLLPSAFVPFLWLALSRAREYSCDRIGATGAGDKEGALLGLSILVAGGKFGRTLNHQSLAAQRKGLNTGWMTLGQWFSTHPPLARRVAAIDPALSPETASSTGGTLRALGIMVGTVLAVVIVGGAGAYFASRGSTSLLQSLLSSRGYPSELGGMSEIPADQNDQMLQDSFQRMRVFLEEELAANGAYPADYEQFETRWQDTYGEGAEVPIDPYDGTAVGYELTDSGYRLWSSGPDGESDTDDDISYEGP